MGRAGLSSPGMITSPITVISAMIISALQNLVRMAILCGIRMEHSLLLLLRILTLTRKKERVLLFALDLPMKAATKVWLTMVREELSFTGKKKLEPILLEPLPNVLTLMANLSGRMLYRLIPEEVIARNPQSVTASEVHLSFSTLTSLILSVYIISLITARSGIGRYSPITT